MRDEFGCRASTYAASSLQPPAPKPQKLGKGSGGLSRPFKKSAARQPAMPTSGNNHMPITGRSLHTCQPAPSPAVCRYFTSTQLYSDNGSSWLTTASHRCCPGPSRGKGWARLRVGRSVLQVQVLRSQTAMHTSARDRYMWL